MHIEFQFRVFFSSRFYQFTQNWKCDIVIFQVQVHLSQLSSYLPAQFN